MSGFSVFSDYQRLALQRLSLTTDRVHRITGTYHGLIQNIRDDIARLKSYILASRNANLEIPPFFAQVTETVLTIKSIVDETLNSSFVAKEALERTSQEIDRMTDSVKQFNDLTQSLSQVLQKVENVTSGIIDIADRTQIIALNSIILAVKSGDFGRGFSVVAREVEKLSMITSNQSQEIQHGLLRIGKNEDALLKQMKENIQAAEASHRILQDVFGTIDGIVSVMKDASKGSAAIDMSTAKMLEQSSRILGQIQGMDDSADRMLTHSEDFLLDLEKYETEVSAVAGNVSQTKALAKECSGLETDRQPVKRILAFPDEPIKRSDPATALYTFERNFIDYMNIRLTRYTESGSIIPFLAESWVLDEDQKTWHFTLKHDACFANGDGICAEDVRFSLERVLHPDMASPHADILAILQGAADFSSGKTEHIQGIKIEDRHSITFHLEKPYNFFLSMLTQSYTSIMQKDNDHSTKPFLPGEPVTAGPFTYAGYDSNEDCDILKANESYIEGRPYLDMMKIYRKLPNPWTAYREDKVSLMFSVPPGIKDANLATFESRRVNTLQVNSTRDNYLTRNKALRHAVMFAIDKARILKDAYDGRAAIAQTVINKSILDTGDSVPFPYDPDRARQIVQSFRDKEDLSAEITVLAVSRAQTPYLEKSGEIIAENLRAIGLNATLVRLPFERVSVDEYKKHDLCYLGNTLEIDLFLALEPFINIKGGDNFFGYSNPSLYERLTESLAIQDAEARKDFFKKMAYDFAEDGVIIPVAFIKNNFIRDPSVCNARMQANEDLLYEKIWLTPGPDARQDNISVHDMHSRYEQAVDTMSRSVDLARKTSSRLGVNISQIIAETAQQQAAITLSDHEIKAFSSSADDLGKQTLSALATIAQAADETMKGTQISTEIQASLSSIKQMLKSILEVVGKFEQDTDNIAALTERMEKTAGKIESIAVVASILSVKGGNWKRDFAKVSSEIRELAHATNEKVAQANVIIADMKELIIRIRECNLESISKLESCEIHLQDNESMLLELNTAIGSTGTLSDLITGTIGEILTQSHAVSASTDDVLASSMRIGNSAQTISFGAQLQSGIMDLLEENVSDTLATYAELEKEFKRAEQIGHA